MTCPGCGAESFDLLETCKICGHPLVASGRRPREVRAAGGWGLTETLDDDAIEVGEEDFAGALIAGPGPADDDGGPPFRIDDDLFMDYDTAAPAAPAGVSASAAWADQGIVWPAVDADPPRSGFAFSGAERGGDGCVEPIIDRDDEVPDRFWAPEVASIGRRALALLVDQSFLLALLGVFFLGAFAALRLGGRDTDLLLAAAGLKASALPFALLAALLSLAYFGYFHGSTGRTPGKALVGIEVRTADGVALTWSRVLLRWLGAALGLACAGVGILWAIFEPRRRGWGDLISGTVVARTRREPAVDGLGG